MTKTIAKAAQKFPQSGGLVRVSQRGVLALMLGTVALPVSGAWAQQVLSGTRTTTQSPTVAAGSPLVVTTASNFSVNNTSPTTSGGIGIDLSSTGGISFTDDYQSAITGFYRGIRAYNTDLAGLGGGGGTALTITTNGIVTGKDIASGGNYQYGKKGDGIRARNKYGGNLTISVESVTGGSIGISARNEDSTGALLIEATGVVTGTNRKGIDAYNSTSGTNLTISANSVSGRIGGIYALNKGSGEAYIKTTGEVTGGIQAKNYGLGALQITASGDVTGTNGAGINAYNTGTSLTISAASVSGTSYGILAKNLGTGPSTITVSGDVSASAVPGYGIASVSDLGDAVTINLLSTSSVNAQYAIVDMYGDAEVTISGGALVTGGIGLQYGNDTLTIGAGVDLSGVTLMSGGDDINATHYTDTLNISSGWSGTLSDWEVINADTSGGDFELGGVVSGSGVFNKRGTGTLLVSGTNTLTGATTVYGGRLNVTGSLGTSSAVTVKDGASLGGTGRVGPLIAQAGATISPGMSIGTLTVNGNLTLKPGSTLAMEVGQNSSDLINATGSASLAGNLVVTPGLGLTFGHTYTLVTASSVTGTFSDISIAGAFDYVPMTSGQLQLNAGSLVDFGGSALSANARAVAGAFDAAVDGGFDPQAFVNLYAQANNFNAAVSQFSGELHSAERRVALADTSVVREAALDRLGYGLTGGADATAATGGGGAFWMRDFASWGTADADATGSRATTDQAGFLMGADFVQGNVKYGGMFSYTNTNVDLGSLGYSKTNSTGAALYAGYRQDGAGLAFAAGGAFASTNATGERSISITGLEQTLTSTVQGTSYQIFGEVSNDMAKAGNVQIEPFARLAYAWAHSDAFAETGGSAALSGAKQSNDLRMATLGLRGAYVAGDTTLSGSAAWLHSAGDLSAPTTLSMAGVDTPYEVNSAALDEDAVELAAQASVDLAPDMTLAGGYSGTIGKNNATHGVRVTLSVAW